jgi:organic hydroperoxide reductase OsmC/OhrA
MSQYSAKISWQRGSSTFVDNHYSRAHSWQFDGGIEVPASSSPHVVPVPMSLEAAVDPEEAFVASLASCHMLWFLSLAAAQRMCVDSYLDDAVGVLGKNAAGKVAMTTVTLKPRVVFSGEQRPTRAAFEALHHKAHEKCFIANSVTTEVRCEPTIE